MAKFGAMSGAVAPGPGREDESHPVAVFAIDRHNTVAFWQATKRETRLDSAFQRGCSKRVLYLARPVGTEQQDLLRLTPFDRE